MILVKYWLPAILWMTLIFTASSDRMSSQNTSRFIGPVLRWLKPDITTETIYRVQFMVRKAAHAGEYAILAWLLWRAGRRPMRPDPRPWLWSHAWLALALCALYAASDEFHQSFVPTRQGQWADVCLDTAGAALGLFLIWRLGRWRRRW